MRKTIFSLMFAFIATMTICSCNSGKTNCSSASDSTSVDSVDSVSADSVDSAAFNAVTSDTTVTEK